MLLLHRARLASVSHAIQQCCVACAAICLRRDTVLFVPFPQWEQCIGGAERCLAEHAAVLQTVHIQFQVLRRMLSHA